MAVVINEFEVVPELNTALPSMPTSGEAAPQNLPSAPEVERVIVYLSERAERVWAH